MSACIRARPLASVRAVRSRPCVQTSCVAGHFSIYLLLQKSQQDALISMQNCYFTELLTCASLHTQTKNDNDDDEEEDEEDEKEEEEEEEEEEEDEEEEEKEEEEEVEEEE